MKKLGLVFCCAALMFICQPLVSLAHAEDGSTSDEAQETTLSDAQKTAITAHCTAIKDSLKMLQKDDSHARVYLGGYYEKIISKYVTPLNTRLVENSLSTPELVENQNKLTAAKATFVSDFVDYQRELENLINTNCESDPENFYANLEKTRAKRKTVASDVEKTRKLVDSHVSLVTTLKEKL